MNRTQRTAIAAAIALIVVAGVAGASQHVPAAASEGAWSADLPSHSPSRRPAATLSATATPPIDDVGDAQSFGRSLTWLGVAAESVELASDCSGAGTVCQPVAAAPATTSFEFHDIARIKLPARASNSLLCYWFSPVLQVSYDNPTAAPVTGQLSYFPSLTIENPVLDDPSLVDPTTGLPFGGSLLTGMTSSEHFEVPLAAGQSLFERTRDSSVCIAGLISRQSLVDNYGLSEAKAREFFRKPMTLRLNVEGDAQFVGDASLYFGLRVVGD